MQINSLDFQSYCLYKNFIWSKNVGHDIVKHLFRLASKRRGNYTRYENNHHQLQQEVSRDGLKLVQQSFRGLYMETGVNVVTFACQVWLNRGKVKSGVSLLHILKKNLNSQRHVLKFVQCSLVFWWELHCNMITRVSACMEPRLLPCESQGLVEVMQRTASLNVGCASKIEFMSLLHFKRKE